MKRQIISLGLMLAATFSLTNCAKEINTPIAPEAEGTPFEIVASVADTKTANNELKTTWVANDEINLFHAVTDGTTYVNDGKFSITEANLAAGKFTGTVNGTLDVEEEYDWYALYPYNERITTPGAQTAGYTYIGYSSGLNQSGYNSMASLKGSVCPLYGILKAWPAGRTPAFEMNHLSSVVEINVTNANDEPLTITTASLTANEDLVGSYYINIVGESVVYTPSSSNYVKTTAIVNVSNGTALAKGESAKLYLAIKPFTATAGQKLTLSVNGYDKELTLDKNVVFTAGKIKTLNFAYDKIAQPAPEGHDYSGEWLITGTDAGKLFVATAVDNGNGNNLKSTLQIAINDNKITEVDGLSDCKMAIQKITDGGTYDGMYTIKDAKGKYLYAASTSSNYLKGTTTLSKDCYWDITLNDNGTYKIVATKSSNRNIMQFNYNSGTPLISCYASSTTTMAPVTLYSYSMVVPDISPRIVVAETSRSSVVADGEIVTFEYELRNLEGENLDVEVSDSEMLSSVEAVDGTITVVVTKNEGESRSATITLNCGGADTVVLTVEQMAAPTGGGELTAGTSYSYTFNEKQFTANGTKTLGELSWILSGNGSYWGYDSTKGQQFGSGNAPYKSMTLKASNYEGGVNRIEVSTSGAKSISGTLIVTVNGVQYGSKVSLSSTNTSYTFNAPDSGMQSGDIVLSYTQTSSKAIYIKSISINN